MKVNIGVTDRIIRVLVAILITGLITNQIVVGMGGIILGSIVVIFVLSSLFGNCPLYTIFGVNTTIKS